MGSSHQFSATTYARAISYDKQEMENESQIHAKPLVGSEEIIGMGDAVINEHIGITLSYYTLL